MSHSLSLSPKSTATIDGGNSHVLVESPFSHSHSRRWRQLLLSPLLPRHFCLALVLFPLVASAAGGKAAAKAPAAPPAPLNMTAAMAKGGCKPRACPPSPRRLRRRRQGSGDGARCAARPPNITAAMAKGGCKAFAALVVASPDAYSTFQSAVDGGVTAFCPTDAPVKSFMPRYKNLTTDGKASLLLFHAAPVYFSLRNLKSNNGVMNTLATDGSAKNYTRPCEE